MKIGFDHEKYIKEQSNFIRARVENYDKLYLEFGGKLINDLHAGRVLPGFDVNAKIKLLQELADQSEIIICVYSGDIERNKVRSDFGVTYDIEVFRTIDELREYGLTVNSVVMTRYTGQPGATLFMNKLTRRGIKVYAHSPIEGYPTDVDTIVSDQGYGKNTYIETTKPIVVVTGPGPGSGKLATSLNQVYHEHKRGQSVGYSKFETFPVWNVPLKHPLNIAYEAATVDLKDVNMLDSFHIDSYGEIAVNYNRDLEMFPVVKRIIEKITGKESVYKSPTDMGVNRVGFGIIDDEVVKEASRQEIIRRYFKTAVEYKRGQVNDDALHRMQLILEELDLKPENRTCVLPAREKATSYKANENDTPIPVMSLSLENGDIITGKSSSLMVSPASCILNALKHLANMSNDMLLISPNILTTIIDLKKNDLHSRYFALSLDEILIALSISAVTNPSAALACKKLPLLKNAQAHSTVILTHNDEQTLRKLGVDVTCDPEFPTENLSYQ